MLELREVEERLRLLFRGIHDDPEVDVVDAEDIAPGWEARIVGFRLTRGKDSTEMVARIYNDASAGKVAELEFEIMHSLAKAGYPTPDVYLYGTGKEPLGSPFIIMEKLPGGSLMATVMGSPEERSRALALFSRLFVELHRVPPRRTFPYHRGYRSTQGRLRYLLSRYESLFEEDEFTVLSPALEWLKAHRREVTGSPLALIHGDFHPGNILLRRSGAPAVLDWTQGDIGDYREDVAWTKMLASTILSTELGEILVDGYRQAAGSEIPDLNYFEALELVRRLVIFLEMMKHQGGIIESRNESSGIKLDQRDHYSRVLARLEALTGLSFPGIRRQLS